MLKIRFRGWFQCRLATDPDPTDEPRGVSGSTFAMVGEPDLDRVIHFQDPVAPRLAGPDVGVRVYSAARGGDDAADHALIGARVELLGSPVFEGRNGLVSEDGREPIVPLHVSVSGG